MREILIDRHRRKSTVKHGRDWKRADFEDVAMRPRGLPDADLMAIDDALKQLEALDTRKAEVVLLRFFAGLTMLEIAEVLEVPLTRVERDWRFARSWLQLRIDVSEDIFSDGTPP